MLAEFGDVGLMTGDVTINPTASCLVMTTEVSFGYTWQLNIVEWFMTHRSSGLCFIEALKLCEK